VDPLSDSSAEVNLMFFAASSGSIPLLKSS